MEMRRFYILILAAVALLTGCDSVGSDERLIEIPPATVQRNVLIDDWATLYLLSGCFSDDRRAAKALWSRQIDSRGHTCWTARNKEYGWS